VSLIALQHGPPLKIVFGYRRVAGGR